MDPVHTLVALTPQDVPAAQTEIARWCHARIVELGGELREARQNLRDVKRLMLGSPKAWQNVVKRTTAKMIYYAKIQAAVRLGYLIVPNFPTEIIAVRVNRSAPRAIEGEVWPREINEAQPELNLPPGAGRYVDETNPHRDLSYDAQIKNAAGQLITQRKRWMRVDTYDETVDFPASLVKPIILEATERALALKLFDRVGVAHGNGTVSLKRRKSDPIVIGHIIDGSQPKSKWMQDYPKYTSFFIAWWLDKDMI